MVKTINEKYDKNFMNRIEQVIMMEMALYGGTHDEYLTEIYEGFCNVLYGKMRDKSVASASRDDMDDIKALEADADNAEVRERVEGWLKEKERDIIDDYENKDIREYMDQIRQGVLNSPLIPNDLRNDGYSYSYVNKAMFDFETQFNRVPEINEKDFNWLVDRTLKYWFEKVLGSAH